MRRWAVFFLIGFLLMYIISCERGSTWQELDLPQEVVLSNSIKTCFFGQDITVDEGAGTNKILMPPDQSSAQNAKAGFADTAGGIVFEIRGTDFDNNITIWTNPVTYHINFAVEWVDSVGTWDSLVGSVSMGEIADEAQDRGFLPGNFQGFSIKALDGDDKIVGDGSGSFGDLPGAPVLWE
jgi:hypothetical protein